MKVLRNQGYDWVWLSWEMRHKNITLKRKEYGQLSSKILLPVKKENQTFWHTNLKKPDLKLFYYNSKFLMKGQFRKTGVNILSYLVK